MPNHDMYIQMDLKEFYPTTKDVARVLCSMNRTLFKKHLLKNPQRCKKEAVWMDYDDSYKSENDTIENI